MKTIAESELILNKDGSVYHLHLLPHEIAETIITVGDPERVREVSKHFDKIDVIKKNREFITHTGTIGNKRLTVISTGIGTDNIDIVFTELDALVNVDLKTRQEKEKLTSLNFIRVGTSGSLQKEVALDSYVISEMAIGMDNLMHFYKWKNTDAEKKILERFKDKVLDGHKTVKPYIVSGSQKLTEQFGADLQKGVTITCSGFYGPQGRVVRGTLAMPKWIDKLTSFKQKEQRITNFEMETSGIYGMAKMLGHEAISISAIVANRVEQTFSKNGDAVIEKLIGKVLERVG